jgi:hypothetical protein
MTPMNQESGLPTQTEIKALFKKLCRRYMKRKTPPADKKMEPLWRMREYVNIEDIITWRDDMGVRNGVVCEDGKAIFETWPEPA